MKKTLLALLLVISSLSSWSAPIEYEAIFNEPGLHGAATTTIEDKFIELLEMATPGSEVLLNIYGLRMPHVAKEIIKAQARGVKIGIIARPFKDKNSTDSLAILKNGFDKHPGMGECSFGKCLKVCGLACSAPAFNHNKFYVFSELSDGSKNISVHTSNNFWPEERNNYNDFLIIKNNKELYDGLRTYWLTLRKGSRNPRLPVKLSENIDIHTFPKGIITFFRSRAFKQRANPMKALLKSVKCQKGSIVHLAHSRFTNARKDIADVLAKLSKDGCDVKVFLKNDVSTEKLGPIKIIADSPGTKIIKKLGDDLYIFPYEEGIDGKPYRAGDPKRNALHSKIIMINAPMGNNPKPQKLVLVGTHNFDLPSLKLNNELLLKITDDKLFDTYQKSFKRLHNAYLELFPNRD